MEEILKNRIEEHLEKQGISLAELSRVSHVPYRTLQDIMGLKRAARITTVNAIAAGLGVSPGKLLEDTDRVEPDGEARKDSFHEVQEFLSRVAALDDRGRRIVMEALSLAEENMEEKTTQRLSDRKSGSESS